MKKFNTFGFDLSESVVILTFSEMAVVKGGGVSTAVDDLIGVDLAAATQTVIGPLNATLDDKRRDRPGGGISTH